MLFSSTRLGTGRATISARRMRSPACPQTRLLQQLQTTVPWSPHTPARPDRCANWGAASHLRASPRPPTNHRPRRLQAPGQSASQKHGSRPGCARSRSANALRPAGGAKRASAWRCRQSANRWWARRTKTACLCGPWLACCSTKTWQRRPNNLPVSNAGLHHHSRWARVVRDAHIPDRHRQWAARRESPRGRWQTTAPPR